MIGHISDGETLLRILYNDTVLRNDSLWPYGLNFHLLVSSYFELTQLRSSCRRHRWPASHDDDDDDAVEDVNQPSSSIDRLRQQVTA